MSNRRGKGLNYQQFLNHSLGQIKELDQEFIYFRKNHKEVGLQHNEVLFYLSYLNDFQANFDQHS